MDLFGFEFFFVIFTTIQMATFDKKNYIYE
jgi:hypothetical protein